MFSNDTIINFIFAFDWFVILLSLNKTIMKKMLFLFACIQSHFLFWRAEKLVSHVVFTVAFVS